MAHVWGLWNNNVSLSQLQESSRTLSFAAKWRGEKGVTFFSEFKHGRVEMVHAAHGLLGSADVVVHYNGRRFDVPTLNKEFVLEGLAPPAPFQQLDLLEIVKRKFRFPSNKLAYVSDALGIGNKVSHTGHDMWVKCLAGDPKAWKLMEKYNKQDTVLLEDLHNVLIPWISNHPHTGLADGVDDACPNCGSVDLRREGYSYTSVGKFQRYQCRNCDAWLRSGKRVSGAEFRGIAS